MARNGIATLINDVFFQSHEKSFTVNNIIVWVCCKKELIRKPESGYMKSEAVILLKMLYWFSGRNIHLVQNYKFC